MRSKVGSFIKRHRRLKSVIVFGVELFWSIRGVTLKLDSIREFIVKQSGSVDLSPGNRRFYSNLFPRLMGPLGTRSVTVLDVGANDGWFAKVVYRFSGADANVISFEPLRSMVHSLEILARKFPGFRFENVAVGASNGTTEITEYKTQGLSSLKGLDASYLYGSHYSTEVVNKYPVEVITIDQYISDNDLKGDVILKIDTQGFEYEVLAGAKNALSFGRIKAVIIEVMTVEKYTQAKLYHELFDLLHAHGFSIFDIHQSYYESDGRLSEFDCVFVRR